MARHQTADRAHHAPAGQSRPALACGVLTSALTLVLGLLTGAGIGCASNRGLVLMLTDYGTKDHYVAVLEANVLAANPSARIVHITHDIEPFNVMQGAFVLAEAVPEFPAGTVVVGIVDPGVGSERYPVVVETNRGHLLVGPDNGLFDPLIVKEGGVKSIHRVENPALMRPGTLSSTFHGRDLFAPVAGHLSRGIRVTEVGPPVSEWERLDVAPPSREKDGASGTIIQVDYYGNILTNIPAMWMEGAPMGASYDMCVGDRRTPVRWSRTYSDVPRGEWLALQNASGHIEVARNLANAADTLNVNVGDAIAIKVRQ